MTARTSFWKNKANHDRTVRPVVCSKRAHQFVIEDDEKESEMSLGYRSSAKEAKTILNRCNRRQRRTFFNTGNSYVFNITSICIHGEKLLRQLAFHQKYEDLKMKQMFDISEKAISEQSGEIYEVKTINWEDSSWKYLSLIVDEQVISLQRTKVYVFSDSVLCPGKMNENPQSNVAWEDRLTWFKSSKEYIALDRIDGEPMEFEWNIFPGFNKLQLSHKVQELLLRLSVTPDKFTGRIIFMSMFDDISWKSNAQLVSLFVKRSRAGQWSFLGPGSEKNPCRQSKR